MAADIIIMLMNIIDFFPSGIVIPVIVLLILYRQHKKSGEPRYDERTEKITGKAAMSTVSMLMVAMLAILYGGDFDLFKLETQQTISILFLTLLISFIAFYRYYNSKDNSKDF